MLDNGNLLTFTKRDPMEDRQKKVELPLATSNPYDPSTSPPDILKFLPPDGSKFGLFSDPYARMQYVNPRKGRNVGSFWLQSRLENSFTDEEVNLISFLMQHRCATRSQIQKVVLTKNNKEWKVKDFLKKCRDRGIISAFSWVTPCQDERKKPLVYGLSRVGVQAAEYLFHVKLPKEYQFQPIEYSMMSGPKMNTFFHNLVANELYVELKRIDRIIKWERSPFFRLPNGKSHQPNYVAEVIKDVGEVLPFWIEVIRLTDDWYEYTIKRFQYTQNAIQQLDENIRPKRIIVIADSDARIPILAQLAEDHMPDAVVRFTTDERLLSGINDETFLMFDPSSESLALSPISFLKEDAPGMKASEFFETYQMDLEDEDEFEE